MVCKGTCQKYKHNKTSRGYYSDGGKRCQICSIFIKWDGSNCPCCGYRLRTSSRNIKYKERLKPRIDSKTKTKFVGNGKNPNLKLFVDKEYFKLVPRLNQKQFEALENSILEDGIQVPIIVNQDGKVLDGHTRYQIASNHNLVISYQIKKFQNIKDERKYVITTNLKRRQLNSFQQFELVESLRNQMIFERRSKMSDEIWATRKGLQEKKPLTHYQTSTDKQLSEITGLGTGQIEACVYVKNHGTPELIEKVRSGEMTPSMGRTILLERDEKFYSNHPERKVDSSPPCDRCNSPTRIRRKCHVHRNICCTKCDWGK